MVTLASVMGELRCTAPCPTQSPRGSHERHPALPCSILSNHFDELSEHRAGA